jgi:hypothetical protein
MCALHSMLKFREQGTKYKQKQTSITWTPLFFISFNNNGLQVLKFSAVYFVSLEIIIMKKLLHHAPQQPTKSQSARLFELCGSIVYCRSFNHQWVYYYVCVAQFQNIYCMIQCCHDMLSDSQELLHESQSNLCMNTNFVYYWTMTKSLVIKFCMGCGLSVYHVPVMPHRLTTQMYIKILVCS